MWVVLSEGLDKDYRLKKLASCKSTRNKVSLNDNTKDKVSVSKQKFMHVLSKVVEVSNDIDIMFTRMKKHPHTSVIAPGLFFIVCLTFWNILITYP